LATRTASWKSSIRRAHPRLRLLKRGPLRAPFPRIGGLFIDGLQMLVELSKRERRYSSVGLLELLETVIAGGGPW
jgi:hypothetical protein